LDAANEQLGPLLKPTRKRKFGALNIKVVFDTPAFNLECGIREGMERLLIQRASEVLTGTCRALKN
jgi:hypothetical protein